MMMEMSKLVITIITTILTTMRMLMPRLTLVRPGGSTVGWPCSKGTTPGILMVTVMITIIMMVMMKLCQFVGHCADFLAKEFVIPVLGNCLL